MAEPTVAPPVAVGADSAPAATDAPDSADVILGSLSPSRASDFKSCPLLYRFRSIDRLPERPSAAATRGTVVHAVLERLFDLPAAERTLSAASDLVEPQWQRLRELAPEVDSLFVDGVNSPETAQWLDSARALVGNYFDLEDPTRLEPAAREERVEVVVDGLRLRGYVDRIDVSPTGDIRIVDYKTGAAPREAFEAQALFQMKFYALVLWRIRGVVPRQLRLIYLADTDTLTYAPDAEELTRFERTLHAIWAAIRRATELGEFQPNPSRLCDWCDHHAHCPAQGGTLPPFPSDAPADHGRDRREITPPGSEPAPPLPDQPR